MNLASGINPDATGFRSIGFVAAGFTPDVSFVLDLVASGFMPDVSFGFLASGLVPDEKTFADKP